MGNRDTATDAKKDNLNKLTKVLSVKEQAQAQLLVVIKVWGIGKIVRNLKFLVHPTFRVIRQSCRANNRSLKYFSSLNS